jgi:hypothetical protein
LRDDSDKGGFAGTIRPEQSENSVFGNGNADIIQRFEITKAFVDVFCN